MFRRLALQLADDGWQVIPVRPGQKIPAAWRWQQRRPPSILRRWAERYPDHGIGLVCGGAGRIVAVDIDVLDPDAAARLHSLAVGQLGSTPLVRVGRWPKVALFYRSTAPMPTERRMLSVGRIELLAEGAFIVGYGVHPDTGRPYSWPGESSPEFALPSALPEVTPLQLEHLLDEALRLFPAVQISEPRAASFAPRADGRSAALSIARCPRSGKVIDGRDAHLAHIVWAVAHSLEHPTAQEIADAAWREFATTADLIRPARDGRRTWAPRDALAKARAALSKVKAAASQRVSRARGRMAQPEGFDLSEHELKAFGEHLDGLHRRGRLNRSEWLVAEFMLSRLRSGQCVDSVSFIAKGLGISPQTVQRARRAVLVMGLFATSRQFANRETTAPYFPDEKLLAKLLAGQVLSSGGVSSLIPIYQGVSPPLPALAPVPAIPPVAEPATPTPPAIPPQAPDAIQLSMVEPAVSPIELREACVAWTDGPPPPIVRVGYTETKHRRGLRECDIAREMGISRTHVSNSRSETFGLSAEYAARVKHWLLPGDFPMPPDLVPIGEKPVRPHHRRGGKRQPDPGPAFPSLRLFAVIEGGEPAAEDQSARRAAA